MCNSLKVLSKVLRAATLAATICSTISATPSAWAQGVAAPSRLIWAVGQPHGRVLTAGERTLLQAWVSDANREGVPDAEVTFLAPDHGDFGGFIQADGARALLHRARTGADGVASVWFTVGEKMGP